MDSDFTTNQHIESLSNGDPSLREVLNRYKFATGGIPMKPSGQMGGHSPSYFGEANAILLSNMLGQLNAKMDNTPPKSGNFDGFQLNINSDVLKWIVLLLLVLLLVWLFLKANQRKKNPLSKKIDKLETEIHRLKKFKKKKEVLKDDDDLDDLEDD